MKSCETAAEGTEQRTRPRSYSLFEPGFGQCHFLINFNLLHVAVVIAPENMEPKGRRVMTCLCLCVEVRLAGLFTSLARGAGIREIRNDLKKNYAS